MTAWIIDKIKAIFTPPPKETYIPLKITVTYDDLQYSIYNAYEGISDKGARKYLLEKLAKTKQPLKASRIKFASEEMR